jgi:DNA-binding Lrp family transcriptional regulator
MLRAMAARAYILIDVTGDKVTSCLAALRAMTGVAKADAVAGPYDIIAVVEGKDVQVVGETVVGKIRQIDGVHETVTCFTFDV